MKIDNTKSKRRAGQVTAAYARTLLDYLREHEINPAGLYSAKTIAEIESPDGRTQIPLAQWLAMIESAITATGDADLPLKVGMSLQMKHLGMLGYVVMSCATIGDSLIQLGRYSRLVGDINQTQLRHHGNKVEVIWQWMHESPVPPPLAQLQLGGRTAIARWLANRPNATAAAYFQFERPANAALYDQFFGEPTQFDQPETKLVLNPDHMKLLILTADSAMQKQAALQADAVLTSLTGASGFLRELKAVLISGLPVGRVSLAASAEALNMSARSLQRRLDQNQCTYRQTLDEVRYAQAAHLLQDSRTSLAQIAFMLGYTEQSTFHNAFKRWSGTTPEAFRASVSEKCA